MRTLIYKRTHIGDPDNSGRFGYYDCMGRVRKLDFDAVIGIDGIGSEARASGIDGKVNWIGIGPRKSSFPELNGSLVRFKQFLLFEADGPDFEVVAPVLADRMLRQYGPRFLFDGFDELEQAEIDAVLRMAKRAKPSIGKAAHGLRTDCARKRHC